MATHTYNPTTARKAKARESGLSDSIHHVRVYPAQGGLIVDHHHLMKHEEAKLGGEPHEFPTEAPRRPSVESGAHIGGEFGTEAKTGIGGRYVFGKTEDALDHLEHHLGQMLEDHEEQRGTQNSEPGEE